MHFNEECYTSTSSINFFRYASTSSSSSSSSFDSACCSDVTFASRDTPDYLAYLLDSSVTSATSQSSAEQIRRSELARIRRFAARHGDALLMDSRGKMYHRYKGELQLAVYFNYGLLTVHVLKGIRLRSKVTDEGSEVSVEVSLQPNDDTDVMYNTGWKEFASSTVFDEKFSFELLTGDENKRLILTVLQRSASDHRVEQLGRMSFGIQRLCYQPASGKFYLLTLDVGLLKHRKASGRHGDGRRLRTKRRRQTGGDNNDNFTRLTIHIDEVTRESDSRGFTVTGECPPYVTRVQLRALADLSGLQPGDRIVDVNGTDTSRLSSLSLANYIRRFGNGPLELEVLRPTRSSNSAEIIPRVAVQKLKTLHPSATRGTTKSKIRPQSACRPATTSGARRRHGATSTTRKHRRDFRKFPTSPRGSPRSPDDSLVIVELDKSPRRVCTHHRSPPPPSSSTAPSPGPFPDNCDANLDGSPTGCVTAGDDVMENTALKTTDATSSTHPNRVAEQRTPTATPTAAGLTNSTDDPVYATMSPAVQHPRMSRCAGNQGNEESHYVDMSVCRQRRRQQPRSAAEAVRPCNAARKSGGRSMAYWSEQLHVGGSHGLVKGATKSLDVDDDYVQLDGIQPLQPACKIAAATANSSSRAALQQSSHSDPFGLMLHDVDDGTFSAFYACPPSDSRTSRPRRGPSPPTTAAASAVAVDGDIVKRLPHVVEKNKSKANAGRATWFPKTRRATRNAIKEFISESLGKLL